MQVAIFQGEKGYSVVANKNQKNRETNAYEASSMFFPGELMTMAKLMTMAFEWIASNEVERVQNGAGGGYAPQTPTRQYAPPADDMQGFNQPQGEEIVPF